MSDEEDTEAEVRELYCELILAVESKHPGVTRHETALRYIQEREAKCEGPKRDKEF